MVMVTPIRTHVSPVDRHNQHEAPPPSFESHGDLQPESPTMDSQTQVGHMMRSPRVVFSHPFTDRAETASLAPSAVAPSLPPYSSLRRSKHTTEEEHLEAMRAWAEEKQYIQYAGDGGIAGFYGNESLEDRSARMKAERRTAKEAKAREKASQVRVDTSQGQTATARRSSMAKFFKSRRRSSAVREGVPSGYSS